ncbi:MAG: type II toxin-antitoxin system RelB/DinJ family antitoxin [Verrucomicrobiaceae bacterium]|nr:type II toxin-antitoxin system RelB/DinJ family antitoxin [Verrucomicrobiaceae bacterium]
MTKTTTFRAKVPTSRLRRADATLQKLGLNAEQVFNMLLAQIELHKGLPFSVNLSPKPVLSAEEQGEQWNEAYGPY